jgi:hypothetical protein
VPGTLDAPGDHCDRDQAVAIIKDLEDRIAQLEKKAVESAVTISRVLDGNWRLARVELPRLMDERDAAIKERDEARRQLCWIVVGGLQSTGDVFFDRLTNSARRDAARAEAERRWSGSVETLFPSARPASEEGSDDAPPPQ